ncbi:hypothetical protein [Novipirellula sp.]|uniref:hypothetical protein n=1 Tax=Novipirellula sp. TaxID=2795430 RepID=UPI00356868F2
MVNAHCLEAPSTLFDDVGNVLAASDFCAVEKHRESNVNGVRRFDTAEFDVVDERSHVDLWLERRLGNKTMFIMVVPDRKTLWRRDHESEQLAERVVNLLVQHGASSD